MIYLHRRRLLVARRASQINTADANSDTDACDADAAAAVTVTA